MSADIAPSPRKMGWFQPLLRSMAAANIACQSLPELEV